MDKYLIKWNAGYGESIDVVEAFSPTEAGAMAYDRWLEEAESNAEYEALLLTKEVAIEYDFESELDG